MKIALCGKIFAGTKKMSKKISNIFNYKIYSLTDKCKKISKDLFDMKYKNNTLINDIYLHMRNIDKTIWVKYILNKIKLYNTENAIINNIRFAEEAKLLKDNDFIIIKIKITKTKQKELFKKKYNNLSFDFLDIYNSKYCDIDNIKEDYYINYDETFSKIIEFINKKNKLFIV